MLASAMVIFATSCKENKKEAENDMENSTMSEESSAMDDTENGEKEITLSALENSPAYENASLTLITPTEDKVADGKGIDFSFDVQNYELGVQTEGAQERMLANSAENAQRPHKS